MAYSNVGTTGSGSVRLLPQVQYHQADGSVTSEPACALGVILKPIEVQILTPA